MKWKKFPDEKPKDGEYVFAIGCSIYKGSPYHSSDMYDYNSKRGYFEQNWCCGGDSLIFSDDETIYWMSIPKCPCGKDTDKDLNEVE